MAEEIQCSMSWAGVSIRIVFDNKGEAASGN